MCYVIITCRSVLWSLCTLLSTFLVVVAVLTPQWLVGPSSGGATPVGPTVLRASTTAGPLVGTGAPPGGSGWSDQKPTLGIYNGCTKVNTFDDLLTMYTERLRFDLDGDHPVSVATYHCSPFVNVRGIIDGSVDILDEISVFWLVSLALFVLGVLMCVVTIVTSVLSLCVRSICGKSIFTVSGLIQAIAALLYVIALILYPAGWGSPQVTQLCGSQASAYLIDDCQLGWAFYLALAGTLLSFLCGMLSIQADISTSTDKVQEEIYKGKFCICLA